MIAAEGEMNAARCLAEAAGVISESPQAIQLRYLQTLTSISAERNSTIIFPLPISLMNKLQASAGELLSALDRVNRYWQVCRACPEKSILW